MESWTDSKDAAETDPALQHSENDSLQVDSITGMKYSVSAQTDITSIFSLASAQDQHSALSHPVGAGYQTSIDFQDLALEPVGSFCLEKLNDLANYFTFAG